MRLKSADGIAENVNPVRLLLQEWSDLGAPCLLRPISLRLKQCKRKVLSKLDCNRKHEIHLLERLCLMLKDPQ